MSDDRRKKIEKSYNNRNQKYLDKAVGAYDSLMDMLTPKPKKKKKKKKINPNSKLGKAASSIRKERDKYRD